MPHRQPNLRGHPARHLPPLPESDHQALRKWASVHLWEQLMKSWADGAPQTAEPSGASGQTFASTPRVGSSGTQKVGICPSLGTAYELGWSPAAEPSGASRLDVWRANCSRGSRSSGLDFHRSGHPSVWRQCLLRRTEPSGAARLRRLPRQRAPVSWGLGVLLSQQNPQPQFRRPARPLEDSPPPEFWSLERGILSLRWTHGHRSFWATLFLLGTSANRILRAACLDC